MSPMVSVGPLAVLILSLGTEPARGACEGGVGVVGGGEAGTDGVPCREP